MNSRQTTGSVLGQRNVQTAIAAVCLLSSACGEASSSTGDVGAIPTWTLHEVRRIGSVADPDYGFSSIAGVAVDDDGLLYVLERQASEIRVYDHDSRIVRRIGRAGSGPGELRAPLRIGLIGDTLWVTDRSSTRLTRFTRSGELIDSRSLARTSMDLQDGVIAQFGAYELRSDGTITSAWMIPRPPRLVADSFDVPWLRLTLEGGIIDTISLQRFALSDAERISIGGREVPAPAGADVHPIHVPLPDGAFLIERPAPASAEEATYTVTRVQGPADTVFRRSYSYAPQPLSADYAAGLAEQYAASWARSLNLDSEDLLGVAERSLDLPAHHPPITSAQVATDGTLWLRREETRSDTVNWTLISEMGTLLAEVRAPREADLLWISDSTVWATMRDELAVPWLLEYELSTNE